VGLYPLFIVSSQEGAVNKSEIVSWVWRTCEPLLAAIGYELIEVEYTGQFGQMILRLYLDKEVGRISLDDCSAATRALDPVLDAGDFPGDNYVLEVSSPGTDRPLRKAVHFARYTGQPVKLESIAPVQGRKRFTGTLTGFEDGLIHLECDGQPYEVHIENLKRANINR